ncbi:MAG: GntR family transcriptional regulator [Armatimonadetes bacterium]|nr:GntR family transcriptional regulator [Armatimonadota bacterium]
MKKILPLAVDVAAASPITTQIKEQIKWLIALGELKAGDQLPTVQELAGHLRVNRNTIALAFHKLRQEGYLSGRQGQGTFVADSDPVREAVRKAGLARLVEDALAKATGMGFTPQEFAAAVAAGAHMHTALSRRRKALFVECNWPEVEFYTHTLIEELGIHIEGMHLDDVRADAEAFRRRTREVDLVITTFYHAEEVHKLLPRGVEMVSLGAGPEVQFLRSLGQLPRGTKVAICCLDNDKATRVRTMVTNIGVQHLDMMAIGVDEKDRLKRALDDADVVYVSNAAYPEARKIVHTPGRLRTYRFHLDRAGVEMLKARLAEWDDHLSRRRKSHAR